MCMSDTGTEVLMKTHKSLVRKVMNNPLNKEIVEYLKADGGDVLFSELEEEFVETGIKSRDLVENIFELYHAGLITPNFDENEDGYVFVSYSYDCRYDETREVVEESLAQDVEAFF